MDDTMAACNEALQRAVELREAKPTTETVDGKGEKTKDGDETNEPKTTVGIEQGAQPTGQAGEGREAEAQRATGRDDRASIPGLALDEVAHEYTFHGAHVPGVTDVIEAAGICDTSWFTDEVADRGHRVHVAIAMYNQGRLALPSRADDQDDAPESVASYLAAYAQFLSDSHFFVLANEQWIFNPTYQYAGTLDLLGRLNGNNTLIDVKSGVPLISHPIQTAAYEACLTERCDRYCLYLRPNGDYRLERNNDPEDFSVFLLALSAYNLNRWKQQRGL